MSVDRFEITNRKIRMGMVGGGEGAFIGAVHRRAAIMDGQIELVCGALDVNPEKGKAFGVEKLYLDPERSYGTYQEMAEKEAALLPSEGQIDCVSIVTPNHMHFPIARTFLEAGFHVICEKPMTVSLEQALELKGIVQKTGKVFVLTHTYTGYPMVKQAKSMVAAGEIGKINKVIVEYPQDWLLKRLELEGNAQAVWRTDPKQSGPAGALGDIGSHCANLVNYITGLEIEAVCADVATYLSGRLVDDDVHVLIRYKGGARGILQVSQISSGEENHLNIRVYGDKASLHWNQEIPNYLNLQTPGEPVRVLSRGQGYCSDLSKLGCRIPPGHPEAYIEAFANIYRGAVDAIRQAESDVKIDNPMDYPNVDDGVMGMAFIETVLESGKSEKKWTPFKQY